MTSLSIIWREETPTSMTNSPGSTFQSPLCAPIRARALWKMDANAPRLERFKMNLGKALEPAHRTLNGIGNLPDVYSNHLSSCPLTYVGAWKWGIDALTEAFARYFSCTPLGELILSSGDDANQACPGKRSSPDGSCSRSATRIAPDAASVFPDIS